MNRNGNNTGRDLDICVLVAKHWARMAVGGNSERVVEALEVQLEIVCIYDAPQTKVRRTAIRANLFNGTIYGLVVGEIKGRDTLGKGAATNACLNINPNQTPMFI